MEEGLMNGSTLAYIGDAVFELMVRSYVLEHGSKQPDRLHKHATALVNAAAQSEMIGSILDELTEDELAIFKRGRNSSTVTSAKHQTVGDYRRATGLEALFGYLYLGRKYERLQELFKLGLERTDHDND
ncbi:MAG: ribonuclease III domain-containing protein [Eubacteriales bacterium]|nr:ribonuclease III domain-containing protein [Eubacteriales bacterium]